MDYPLSQPGLDLYLNKFTDGVPGVRPASVIPSATMNAVLDELLAVITAAGIAPSEAILTQLLFALRSGALVYGIDTGAANACAVAYTPAISAPTDGMVLWFKAKSTNTGASTLNVNALGASPLVGAAHSALQGGEIIANGRCMVVWNATINSWVLIECTGGALQVAAGGKTGQAVNLGQFNSSLNVNGYEQLPNGRIRQWGTYSNPSWISTSITFPIAFPNNLFNLRVNEKSTTTAHACSGTPSGLTGFTAYVNGPAANYTVDWEAIGN